MAAAASSQSGELSAMYDRKLRAMTAIGLIKRVLDPKLDTTWKQAMEVTLAHRDAVAADMHLLISSFDKAPFLAAAEGLDAMKKAGDFPQLFCLPFVVSDTIETESAITSAGLAFLDEWDAGVNAPVVSAALATGAQFVGKSSVSELGLGASGFNPSFGTARNPHNKKHIAGGAAAGAAACVAARCAAFALGVDVWGCVRIPSALCGVTGFRPTRGRYPAGGTVTVTELRESVSVAARSADDLVLIDAALRGDTSVRWDALPPAASLAGVTLAVATGTLAEGLAEEVAAAFRAACDALSKAGAKLVEVDTTDIAALSHRVSAALDAREAVHNLSAYFWERGAKTSILDITAAVQSPKHQAFLKAQLRSDREGYVTADQFEEALAQARPALRAALDAALATAGAEAMLWPTTIVTAPTLEAAEAGVVDVAGAAIDIDAALSRQTAVAGNASWCAVTIPAGVGATSRLPVGLELVAAPGADERLLSIARAAQAALPELPAPRGM